MASLFERLAPTAALVASGERLDAAPTVPEPAPYSAPRPMQGSAERYNLKKEFDRQTLADRPYQQWQQQAWKYYDDIGEIKYAFGLIAAVFSRLRLYPALVIDEDAPPVSVAQFMRREAVQADDEKETDKSKHMSLPTHFDREALKTMREYVDALGSGHGGITGLLRTYSLNMSTPGECYLVHIDNTWSIRSTEEVGIRETDQKPILRRTRTAGNAAMSTTRGSATPGIRERELPQGTWIGRIWRPHPRFSGEPDSSMLALLERCDELLTLQRMIRATARSKMNAGMLFVPDSITAAGASVNAGLGEETDQAEEEAEQDAFLAELMNAMVEPVEDETSVYTVVPTLARGPGEEGDKIKWIDFSRTADAALVARADKTLERILQGLDIPKDIVTGLANVKYSNAVQIDDSLYKSHIEPMALLLCDALTMIYLRPAVKKKHPSMSEEDLRKIVVWYDPTEVVTRVDPASSATTGYENFALSADTWRRSHGFSDLDAPGEKEIALRLAMEKAQIPPEVATELIRYALPSVLGEEASMKNLPQSAQSLLKGGDGTSIPGEEQSLDEAPAPSAPVSTAVTQTDVPDPAAVPATSR